MLPGMRSFSLALVVGLLVIFPLLGVFENDHIRILFKYFEQHTKFMLNPSQCVRNVMD
jgi:hypothetical protein